MKLQELRNEINKKSEENEWLEKVIKEKENNIKFNEIKLKQIWNLQR